MKTQFLAFLSFAVVLSADAATVHKAPLKRLLIDNASVVTNVTGMDAATRLETADGRMWIDAAGDVRQAQRKAVFNGMEAFSGDDPSGTVEWMFYDDGPEGGYCQMFYYAGRWDLALERLEDVDVDENGDVRQEMVQRTWSANAPWNSSTVTLNGDWGTETVQLSFVTGIVNRIAFTNDVPKIDFSKIPTLTTNDVCNIVTNEMAVIGDWVVTTNGAYAPGWRIDIMEFSVDDTPVFDVSLLDHEGSQIVILDTIGIPDPTATCYSGTIMEDVGGYGYLGIAYTAERKRITRNALGLAMAKDLEKLPTHETVTNVARSVVTNEVSGWSAWSWSDGKVRPDPEWLGDDGEERWRIQSDLEALDYYDICWAPENATMLTWANEAGSYKLTARRHWMSGNALGLAMAKDLEKLPTHETVANVARAVSNSFWDEKNEVLWRMEFRDGEPMFVPVTNENIKATGGVL